VRAVDWERKGSEGSTPRKGRRAVAPAKSRRMMGPQCSGELRGTLARGGGARLRWLGHGREENGDGATSGVFEKRLSGTGQRGKRGSVWAHPHGGGGWRRGGHGAAVVARGGQQRPPIVGRGRRRCRANRGARRAWATREDGVSVTDGRDRGEAGPSGSGRGAQCRAAWFKLDLKPKI
jgi:hypothetical protein